MSDTDTRPLADDANGPRDATAANAHVPRAVYTRVLAELDAIRALVTGDGAAHLPQAGLVRDVYELRRRAVVAERRLDEAKQALARRPIDAAGCAVRAGELLDKAAVVAAVGRTSEAEALGRVADRWIGMAALPGPGGGGR
jgi:hypothetical protein